jgi:3-ketosteroid 9alpha-monooxygenase subunit B
VCRRLDGEITMVANEVLDDADLADGYVLACQSLPAGDKIVISYD